ncbi:hypothetical protein FKM82_024963 [Ascaphus truei]
MVVHQRNLYCTGVVAVPQRGAPCTITATRECRPQEWRIRAVRIVQNGDRRLMGKAHVACAPLKSKLLLTCLLQACSGVERKLWPHRFGPA